MFINIRNPSDTRKDELRKAIRSQAATSSASCRKNTIAAKTAPGLTSPEEDNPPKKRRKSKTQTAKQEPEDVKQLSKITPASLPTVNISPPSPSGRHTSGDPFWTYPSDGAWHITMPRLVDTYLVHIAPTEQNAIYSSSRQILRKELWPEILSHGPLFFANMLLATSHQSFLETTSPQVVAWYRHQVICSIQRSLDSSSESGTSNQLIAAVSLLCGWELEFGEPASFRAHLAGLKTMIDMRGGLESPSISTVTRQVVLSVTHNLLLYAGMHPIYESETCKPWNWDNTLICVKSFSLPEGFDYLRRGCLVFPTTLEFVHEVCTVMKGPPSPQSALQDLQLRLAKYDYICYLSVDYCPVQSPVDDAVNNQAEKHIKHALSSLLSGIDDSSAIETHLPLHELVPGILNNTVYAEVSTWALLIICATHLPPHPTLFVGLNRLLASQNIRDWIQVEQLLQRYIYPQDELQFRCKMLLDRLSRDVEAGIDQEKFSRYNTVAFVPSATLISDPAGT